VDTVFLMPSEEYFFLTSTLVKEVAGYGGEIENLVPKSSFVRLQKKFPNGKGAKS
jgi:pantetheine-phosphate adenylyltransferase